MKAFRHVGWLIIAFLPLLSQAQIHGIGSANLQPLYAKWAETYAQDSGMHVTYQSVTAAEGLQRMRSHQADFAVVDIAPSDSELRKDNLRCFPVAVTSIVPVVNLPGIKAGELQLTGEQLAAIFSRQVKNWNDPALTSNNPALAQVKLPITTVADTSAVATNFYASDYLSKISSKWYADIGRSERPNWPSDTILLTSSPALVQHIVRTPGSIAFVDYAQMNQNHLSYARMQNREGSSVHPRHMNVEAAVIDSDWRHGISYSTTLTNGTGSQTWPITAGAFMLLPQDSDQPQRVIASLKFLSWIIHRGDQLAMTNDFTRIPDRVQAHVFHDMFKITDNRGQLLATSL